MWERRIRPCSELTNSNAGSAGRSSANTRANAFCRSKVGWFSMSPNCSNGSNCSPPVQTRRQPRSKPRTRWLPHQRDVLLQGATMNNPQYLLRFDDICPTMNWRVWAEIESVLIQREIKPLLAVVPDNH